MQDRGQWVPGRLRVPEMLSLGHTMPGDLGHCPRAVTAGLELTGLAPSRRALALPASAAPPAFSSLALLGNASPPNPKTSPARGAPPAHPEAPTRPRGAAGRAQGRRRGDPPTRPAGSRGCSCGWSPTWKDPQEQSSPNPGLEGLPSGFPPAEAAGAVDLWGVAQGPRFPGR